MFFIRDLSGIFRLYVPGKYGMIKVPEFSSIIYRKQLLHTEANQRTLFQCGIEYLSQSRKLNMEGLTAIKFTQCN